MKINYNKESDGPFFPTFGTLSLADTFCLLSESDEDIDCPPVYMVIEKICTDEQGDDEINAVCLNTGITYWIRNEAKIIPLPLEASLSISKKLVF